MAVAPSTHSVTVLSPKGAGEPVSPRLARTLVHPDRKAGVPVLQFSPDGRRLFTASYPVFSAGSGVVQFWDVASGREVGQIVAAGPRDAVRDAGLPADWSAVYLPFSSRKVLPDEKDGERVWRHEFTGSVQVYDAATGNPGPR